MLRDDHATRGSARLIPSDAIHQHRSALRLARRPRTHARHPPTPPRSQNAGGSLSSAATSEIPTRSSAPSLVRSFVLGTGRGEHERRATGRQGGGETYNSRCEPSARSTVI